MSSNLIALALLGGAVGGQDAPPEAQLRRLKLATVVVRSESDTLLVVGSGFLFRRQGDAGLIVTNYDVATASAEAEVIFNSGEPGQVVLPALLVGTDQDRNLALLGVRHRELPEPAELSAGVEPGDKMPVFVLGAQMGAALVALRRNPRLALGKGTVSSLRKDKAGKVVGFDVADGLNGSNSGGPIFDAAGALVGVGNVKNAPTAVPVAAIEEMLVGRVDRIGCEDVRHTEGSIAFRAWVRLSDPYRRIKSLEMLVIPKDKVRPGVAPDAAGQWGPVAEGMLALPLEHGGAAAQAPLTLKGDPSTSVEYVCQARFSRGDGKILHTPPSPFTADFRKGAGKLLPSEALRRKRETAAPKMTEVRGALAGEKRTVVDAACTDLRIDPQKLRRSAPVFSEDGKFLYCLEDGGLLRQIAVPGFVEERQLAVGHPARSLQRSKEGLILLVPELRELWVVDEATLAVKKRIDAREASSNRPPGLEEEESSRETEQVSSGGTLSVAFGVTNTKRLVVMDLKLGTVVKTLLPGVLWDEAGPRLRRHGEATRAEGVSATAVTPDGKYLLSVWHQGIQRFSVNGAAVTLEEAGPPLVSRWNRLEVSLDSKFVALLSSDGNRYVEGHPRLIQTGTYFYKVTDLQTPAGAIPSGGMPACLAWDRLSGKVYAHDLGFPLQVFTPQGTKEMEYPLSERGDAARLILPHPAGRKLLVLTGRRTVWAELPASSVPNVRRENPASAEAGKAVETGTVLPATKKELEGAGCTEVQFAPKTDRTAVITPLTPTAAWSEDGKWLYTLEENGLVRKLSVPDFREERRLALSFRCRNLQRSREGLLVSSPRPADGSQGELFLIDEGSLSLKARIAVPEISTAASAPGLSTAVCAARGGLAVVDLKKLAVVKTVNVGSLSKDQWAKVRKPKDQTAPFVQFGPVAMSPDGSALVWVGDNRLHRAAVKGTEITIEEIGPRVALMDTPVFSPDSRYVAVPQSVSQPPPEGHPPLAKAGTYVYRLSDLQRPAVTLAADTPLRVLSFEKVTGRIYAATLDWKFLAFDPKGVREKEYSLGDGPKIYALSTSYIPQQVLAHPQGSKVLLTSSSYFYWLDLGK